LTVLFSLLSSWVMQTGREAVGLAGSVPPVVLRNQHLNVFWGCCRSYYTRTVPQDFSSSPALRLDKVN
jgi:hypothetical protein